MRLAYGNEPVCSMYYRQPSVMRQLIDASRYRGLTLVFPGRHFQNGSVHDAPQELHVFRCATFAVAHISQRGGISHDEFLTSFQSRLDDQSVASDNSLAVFKRILRFLKSPVSCLDRRLNGFSLRGRDASHQPADVMHSLLRWVPPPCGCQVTRSRAHLCFAISIIRAACLRPRSWNILDGELFVNLRCERVETYLTPCTPVQGPMTTLYGIGAIV